MIGKQRWPATVTAARCLAAAPRREKRPESLPDWIQNRFESSAQTRTVRCQSTRAVTGSVTSSLQLRRRLPPAPAGPGLHCCRLGHQVGLVTVTFKFGFSGRDARAASGHGGGPTAGGVTRSRPRRPLPAAAWGAAVGPGRRTRVRV